MTFLASAAVPLFVAMMLVGCGDTADEPSNGSKTQLVTVGNITIDNSYAPEPVTPDVGALYFTVRNHGTTADTLLTVEVDGVGDVSLHDQERSGSSMQMVAAGELAVPAGESVTLEPGGLHAMLQQLEHHHRAGDFLTVTATFNRAGPVSFSVPVISYADVVERLPRSHDERGQH